MRAKPRRGSVKFGFGLPLRQLAGICQGMKLGAEPTLDSHLVDYPSPIEFPTSPSSLNSQLEALGGVAKLLRFNGSSDSV